MGDLNNLVYQVQLYEEMVLDTEIASQALSPIIFVLVTTPAIPVIDIAGLHCPVAIMRSPAKAEILPC